MGLGIALSILGLMAGCKKSEPAGPAGRPLPKPNAPARYGPPPSTATLVATNLAPVDPAGMRETNWSARPYSIVETELSPAILLRSTNRYLGLFTELRRHGLGAPSHVAWSTPGGPRAFQNGKLLDVAGMEENWLLVWFTGASGWNQWDSPWAVFLQHRLSSMRLDSDGLFLTFPREAGEVVLLPLYGAWKAPASASDPLMARQRDAKKKNQIKTWEWAKALPRDPLVRLRFWAGATREFPVRATDEYSVHRAEDSVTLRSRIAYHRIVDDWGTRPLRLAPISPVLGLALLEPGLPVRFSGKPFDLEIFTPAGPYFGIPEAEGFDATFPVLAYIHETEATPDLTTNAPSPALRAALDQLRQAAREMTTSPAGGGMPDAWKLPDAPVWLARSLPHLDAPDRAMAAAALRQQLSGETEARFEALWAYAHFSGDWDFIRARWAKLRNEFRMGAAMNWTAFGRTNITDHGELAAPCAAYARLAYQAGDLEAYGYACSLFARELVHLWVRQRGAGYFRAQQPVHSMELMDEEVFLTDLAIGSGWNLDGPRFPGSAKERKYTRRWNTFKDPDVARFLQDYLGPDIRREINWLVAGPARGASNEAPDGWPDGALLTQLQSLLGDHLGEPSTTAPGGRSSQLKLSNLSADGIPLPASRRLAGALAVIRAMVPPEYERLIPPAPATPFVIGLERERREGSAPLIATAALLRAATPGWPELRWTDEAWRGPDGGPWSFGQIKFTRSPAPPRRTDGGLINWNTRVVVVE
jgi:hypothetical protein